MAVRGRSRIHPKLPDSSGSSSGSSSRLRRPSNFTLSEILTRSLEEVSSRSQRPRSATSLTARLLPTSCRIGPPSGDQFSFFHQTPRSFLRSRGQLVGDWIPVRTGRREHLSPGGRLLPRGAGTRGSAHGRYARSAVRFDTQDQDSGCLHRSRHQVHDAVRNAAPRARTFCPWSTCMKQTSEASFEESGDSGKRGSLPISLCSPVAKASRFDQTLSQVTRHSSRNAK
jgi:hypothetical protein